MKKSFKKLMVLLLSIFLVSATLPAQKQKEEIKGVWYMVSGSTNGNPNVKLYTDRIWIFSEDNTFEGKIFLPDNSVRKYNEGIYMLPNDTTMVCLHKNRYGKMDRFALTYNYTISNDSLHFYGYYFINAKENPKLLQPVHIDEWWVKNKERAK